MFGYLGSHSPSIRRKGAAKLAPSADAAGFPMAPLLFNADDIASRLIDR
ncbi:MAG: hypothetical protein R3F37_12685 [Candidatus Competibacteraceae bacterium]